MNEADEVVQAEQKVLLAVARKTAAWAAWVEAVEDMRKAQEELLKVRAKLEGAP